VITENIKISVIGLGYVGLPLAVAFSEKYEVVGIDNSAVRIDELREGFDITLEVDSDALNAVEKNITFSTDISDASGCNIYIVTVPTPIDNNNCPDLQPLLKSSQLIGSVIKKDDVAIYESTVYPGVTEDLCLPEIEKVSGLKFNEDFFAGYSPERINPGDKERTLKKIKKVTSGSTPEIAIFVDELYNSIIDAGTHLASSIKVAEASKIIENTQRDVNIALINEIAYIFDQMGIDTKEVIEAAATKWNFIELYPGLVGGHCIGVDPYYLTYRAQELGYSPDLILAARQINNSVGRYVAEKTIKKMIESDKLVKGAQILMLGLTFKENCPDMRNTKVVDIISELESYGVNVDVYDPWIDNKEEKKAFRDDVIENPLTKDKKYDAIIVSVAHDEFRKMTEEDYKYLSAGKPIIIDIKGIVPNPSWRF
jgi:UDP-N-acetyl-D-glucosamine/UDP-N-acetyl-D-galactosamine dehydrogenase